MKLALAAGAWLAGTVLALWIDPDPIPVLLLFFASLAMGLLLRLGRRSPWPAALAAVLLLGLWRAEVADGPPAALARQDEQTVALRGRIASDPEPTARRIKFTLEVEAIDRGSGWEPHDGKALVYADPPDLLVARRQPPYFRYGDVLLLRGVLQRPQPLEAFDYPAYLSSQGISAVFWSREAELVSPVGNNNLLARIFDLRRKLSRSIEAALPARESALARALLLGLRGQLPPDVVADFRNTGTSHLLAISGLHVGVALVMAMGASLWLLGKQRQVYLLLPLVSIWDYALISGLSVPVVRAAIMGSIYLAALALGRPRSALPTLALSAAVMTAVEPQLVTQVSFQLSFAAMGGIILALPMQARLLEAIDRASAAWSRLFCWHIVRWALVALVVSVAATLATWPLVAFHFHRVPVWGVLTTTLALPALPFILLGSLATAVAGLVHPVLGQLAGWVAQVPLAYLLRLVSVAPDYTVATPWAGSPLIVAWYLVLGAALFLPYGLARLRRAAFQRGGSAGPPTRGHRPALGRPVGPTTGFLGLALVLLASGGFLWAQFFSGPDGRLHVYFFDVGQGDSALIVTPGGRQVLVDGGPEADSATLALAGPLSPADRSLDMVVLTHLDADHSRGLLEVLARYRVASVIVGVPDSESDLWHQWQAALERQSLTPTPVSAGYRIALERGVSLEVLNPPPDPVPGAGADQNNSGVVLRLTYREVSFLLAADIESEAENYLMGHARNLESTVLKVPHHGSKTSSTAAFLERVDPALAVVSAGRENPYGHPHPEVVARLEEAVGPERLYRTDQRGSIEFISDGRRLWVRTER